MVSNKTVVSTAATSEIASVNNFDYSFESLLVLCIYPSTFIEASDF